MTEAELISACIRNDKIAKKQFFETYYKKFAFIALRYSKSKTQSEDIVIRAFANIFSELHNFKNQTELNLEAFSQYHLILFIVNDIKNIRNEYYVASTVRASEAKERTYDLFLDNVYIDLNSVNQLLLLKSMHELVPSQRLAFNLHVIDGYNLLKTSNILETSEQTVKSNIEKARFNLQKSIEKNLKYSQNEQSV